MSQHGRRGGGGNSDRDRRGASSDRGGRGGSSDWGGRGGSSDRGGRGRDRQHAAQAAPPSPLLKAHSKPLLSESFLRFPRGGEIQMPAADVCSFAILDGTRLII
jgi:hypothetical protein